MAVEGVIEVVSTLAYVNEQPQQTQQPQQTHQLRERTSPSSSGRPSTGTEPEGEYYELETSGKFKYLRVLVASTCVLTTDGCVYGCEINGRQTKLNDHFKPNSSVLQC